MKYLAIIGLLSLSLFSQEIDDSFSNDTVSLDTVSKKTVSTASKTKSYAHKKITLWQKTFGGSDYDEANAITPTKDGGFIVAGATYSFGNGKWDVYLIKIDKNGNKIWQKTFGGSENDEVDAITPTKDGGFIVAGSTDSFGNGEKDVYLIKIDKNGNKIWQKTFGGSKDDEVDAITPTKDGGFIVAGRTYSFGNGGYDVYLIKIDKNGNKIWQKTFGGSENDEADAITPTKDGGFIIAGSTKSFGNGNDDVYLIKIDKNGDKIWQKTFGGSDDDSADAIIPTKDGGFIIAGATYSFGNNNNNNNVYIIKDDVYLIKIDKNGNKIWQKTFGGSENDEVDAITPTKDGGFIVAGSTDSFGNGEKDVYLIKIDKNGNKIWQKTFGRSEDDEAYAITPTKDGGFIVAGSTASFSNGNDDVYLIKTVGLDTGSKKTVSTTSKPKSYAHKKITLWQKTFEGTNEDIVEGITPTKDGGFILDGSKWFFNDATNYVHLIKIDKNGNKIWQRIFGHRVYEQAITPTKDGGFIVVGNVYIEDLPHLYLIKIDKDGKKRWRKLFRRRSDTIEASVITPTKDGGFIVVGRKVNSYSNDYGYVKLIKIDKNGNKIWQKLFRKNYVSDINAITPTKDGGFIVAGDNGDVYLIKIDKNGNKIWQKTFGGNHNDYANAITPTKDAGFIVAGGTNSFGNGKDDAYLIKIDKNGNKIWQKTFGGNHNDYANAITPTKDAGFIVAGGTNSFGNGKDDAYLIKIDKNGNKIWQKTFGGNHDDYANAIAPTKDGGFIVAGYTEYRSSNGRLIDNVYLIKIDKNGKSSSGKNLKIAPR